MFSTKNLSPRQLSAFTAALLAIPISIGIYFLTNHWKFGLGSLIMVFAGSYGLVLFTLEKFIYRKIKLIYKLIHQTKATRSDYGETKKRLYEKSIDEVREDVHS